jgi:tRNA threonylcarbamoyladenosine biosynthesis protein TsaE
MQPDVTQRLFEKVDLKGLKDVAKELTRALDDCKVCIFHGEMGAGKTTLIKAMCSELGVSDTMSSPTFSIVNEYKLNERDTIFHFDFYRIRSEEEAYQIGAEDYFFSGQYCFIEWPDKVPSLLPDFYADISITINDSTSRTIAISFHGGEEKKRI